MKFRIAYALTACLVLPMAVGCSSQQQLVRGQNPDMPMTQPGQPGMYRNVSMMNGATMMHSGGQCPTCPNDGGVYGGMVYADGYCPDPYCQCNGHGSCWSCLKKLHGHHHFYRYKEPRGLVYPPANSPAAVVQYPYYTHKGPSDYFLTTSPE